MKARKLPIKARLINSMLLGKSWFSLLRQ